jgi:uncharacterized RDD family membrane protein YckC
MAAAAKKAVSSPARPKQEKVINFEPERLRAPFFLRCAALAIDYLLFISPPVFWLLISRPLSDSGATASIAPAAWLLGVVVSIVNVLVLPLWRGQSAGKLLTGLTILNTDGTKIGIATLVKRNLLGYFVTLLTLGIGFLISAVNARGRSLHDLIAGTVVVRGRKTPV